MKSYLNKIIVFAVSSILFGIQVEQFSVKTESLDKVVVSFENQEVVTNQIEGYERFSGYSKLTISEGLPELPKYTLKYGLNPNKKYNVSYNVISSHIVENIDIYPYQPVKNNDNTIYVESSYLNSSGVFPENIVIEEIGNLRGNQIMMIDVIPFSYDMQSRALTVYDEIEVTIQEVGDSNLAVDASRKFSKPFQNMYESMILGSFDSREIEYQEPSILYICGGGSSNSAIDYAYLDYLIDWRKRQGYEVTAVDLTTIGGSSTSYIENYIEDAYYNWENPPEFVTLIGDANGSLFVPTYNVGGGSGWSGAYGEGDLPYVLIEGDDYLADAFIGRISVRSESEFNVVVNKILGYERLYSGSDWIESVALVGDPYDSGISTVITNEYIAQIMEDYGVEDINEQYSGSNTFDDFMVDQLNNGVSYLNYRGFYGFSNFDENDISQLTNGFKLPFLTTLTCDTGSFSTETSCDSEDLLRAGTQNNPKGAVAVVATAQPYTHTAFNNIVAMGMYSGIFLYEAKTAGEALAFGEMALSLAYPQNPNNNVYYFAAWNNLMGDAATMLWTDTPSVLVADHPDNVSTSSDIVDILVIDEYENPMEGANVNLRLNNTYVNGITDSDGYAFINISDLGEGTVDVTVTCQDCVYAESSFVLSSNNEYPQVNDEIFLSELVGNGDGYLNPGEEFNVSFNLTNDTNINFYDIHVQLKSTDIMISSDNIVTIETLGQGESILVEGLTLNLPSSILPDTEPIFFIHLSDDASGYEIMQQINLNINSGSVFFDSIRSLDPGDNENINIIINNSGEINFNHLNGEILYSGSDLFFSNTDIDWGNLDLDSNADLVLPVQVSVENDIINGTIINVPIRVYSDYTFEHIVSCQFVIGNVTTSDPLGPDPYGYYIYDESDTDYDLAPSYSWVEIVPSLGGDGYQLDLNDNGNNQDDVTTIDLPFTFTFYGEDYDEVSVCSNGWISFGETDLESFRNYPIPGTGGPSPMVAVFWDDLEDGDAYAFYDEENDSFIIEWYNYDTYYANTNEEFQIILFNTGSQTPTGDDEMLLQYRDFGNTSVGSYPVGNYNGAVIHGQYASVGIEDHTGLVGLEYTFNDEYPSAAAELSDQSALFITTRTSSLYAQPQISVSDTDFDLYVDADNLSDEILSITNSGEPDSYLTYEVTMSPFSNQQSNVDNFGYAWSSSDADDYIDYNWIDISNENTTLEFSSNDLSPGYFGLDFNFPFYGEEYDQILINPNGWIGFGDDNSEWDNQSIFDDGSPMNAILGYWDDLNPVSADNEVGEGYVRYHSNDERIVVWYDDVIHWTSSEIRCDFQIILYPSGDVVVNYRDIQGVSNDGATIGIVNSDGSIGQQVPYEDLDLDSQLSILYKMSPNWLSLSQLEGTLDYQETDDVLLNIDMEGYEDGVYSSYLIVESNASADIIIPITVFLEGQNYLLGDLNSDGGIDILDVVRLVSVILNGDGTGYELAVSDLNGDDDVNILDVILLVQIILNV